MKFISILGQTASGKSDFALKIAKKVNGEIISVDSVSVYKELNIGSAKPSREELLEIPHHCIDLVNPDYAFTASDFAKYANEAISEISKKGKIAILSGGTYFYYNSLNYGLWPLDEDENQISEKNKILEKWNNYESENGLLALYNKLQTIDPESATEIYKEDKYRIIRALTIFDLTGKKRSEIKKQFEENKKALISPSFEIAFVLDRPKLVERITFRTQKMLDNGLIDEVSKLLQKYSKESKSLKSIGYREIVDFLDGKITIEQAKAQIIQNTIHLAKAQKTWLKRQDNIIKINPYSEDMNNIEARILEWLNPKL